MNSTFWENTARTDFELGDVEGGGIAALEGTVRLASTIVAGNTATIAPDFEPTASDLSGDVSSLGNNLVGSGDGAGGAFVDGVNGDVIGTDAAPVDPLLGPLQDNGGPTLTHAPLPGSPAIDAGANPLGLATDQRGEGFPRAIGGQTDIGAVESGGDEPGFDDRVFLVDARSEERLGEVTPGATLLRVGEAERDLTLLVDTDEPAFSGSVEFRLFEVDETGADMRLAASAVENFSPYALYADEGTDDLNIGEGVDDGDYRLELIFYSEDDRGGKVVGSSETRFEVDDATVADLATVAFVDTEADTVLGELTPVGDRFIFNAGSADPADLGLLAEVPDPRIDSVRLTLRDEDGFVHRQLENNVPYALFSDDSRGDFKDGAPDLDAGTYELTLELFAGPNATDLVASDIITIDLLIEGA